MLTLATRPCRLRSTERLPLALADPECDIGRHAQWKQLWVSCTVDEAITSIESARASRLTYNSGLRFALAAVVPHLRVRHCAT